MKPQAAKPLIRERWESSCGRVVLLSGDAFKIAPTIEAAMLCADPPYGIGYQHNGGNTRHRPGRLNGRVKPGHGAKLSKIRGDSKPFDPAPFINSRRVALFGAGHFMQRLPANGHLAAWDKRNGKGANDHFVDAEMIWLNWRTPRNIISQLWKGICREKDEEDAAGKARRLHVSQKPIRVMMHLIREARLAPDSMVLDPFMGSGSTGIAALKLGHRFTGIEIDAKHFKTAKKRFEAFLMTLEANEHSRAPL